MIQALSQTAENADWIHFFITVSTFFTQPLAGYLLCWRWKDKVEQKSLMTSEETSRSSSSGCPCLFAGMLRRLSIRRTRTKSHTCFLAGCGRSGREEESTQPFPSAMAGPLGVKRPSEPPCGSRQQCILTHNPLNWFFPSSTLSWSEGVVLAWMHIPWVVQNGKQP